MNTPTNEPTTTQETVLLAVDHGHDAGPLLDVAERLAHRASADVVVLHVHQIAKGEFGPIVIEVEPDVDCVADELADKLVVRGVAATSRKAETPYGRVADAIARTANSLSAGLVIVGSHSAFDGSAAPRGTIAEQTVALAGLPVLMLPLLRPGMPQRKDSSMTCHDDYDFSEPMTHGAQALSVVGIDGSAASAAALRWAVAKTEAGGEIRAVYVFNGHTAFDPDTLPVSGERQHEAEDEAREFVRAALADGDNDSEVRVTSMAVPGDPQRRLVSLSAMADMLVLGASSGTSLAARVLGSTGSACATHAKSPVMFVPETWAAVPAMTHR